MPKKVYLYNRYILTLVLILSPICSLSTSLYAGAMSAYDDVIHNTPQVLLKRGTHTQDVTSDYVGIVSDCSRWTSGSASYIINCVDFNTKLNTAFNNASGWFVVERTAKVDFSIGNQVLVVGDKYLVLGVNDAIGSGGQFSTIVDNNDQDPSAGLFLDGNSSTCSAYVALDSQLNL